MPGLSVENRIGKIVQLGVISCGGISIDNDHPLLDQRLGDMIEKRKAELVDDEDDFRKACRNMLRNGTYKPTGRGKPASEYLLRAASDSSFPRINTIVDINNYISLKYLVPISLWDQQKAATQSYLFKTGNEGENYVFNRG